MREQQNDVLKFGFNLCLVSLCAFSLLSCKKSELVTMVDNADSLNAGLETPGEGSGNQGDDEVVGGEPSPELPDVSEVAPIPPVPAPPKLAKMEPLSWESSSRPQASKWSAYAHDVIREEAFVNLNKAADAELFCPKYDSLTEDQKINFWGALFSGITKFESNYSPTSRMQETTMGTDPVTKQPVYSEGLLQLSYQDVQWAPYCEFDWSKDKYLSAKDPKKTILDPYKNLRCGILIMANQIKKKGNIVLSSGVYWAVLKRGGKYQKINDIIAITKKLSFCK